MHVQVNTRRDRRVLLGALVSVDALTLIAAVAVAGFIRISLEDVLPRALPIWTPMSDLPIWNLERTLQVWPLETDRHLVASLLVVPVLLALFALHGLYDFDLILAGTREYGRIAYAVTYAVPIAFAASYIAGGERLVSRLWLLLVWVACVLLICIARFLFRRGVRALRRRGSFRTRIVIVGASTLGVHIAEQLQGSVNEGLDVVGFLDEYIPLGHKLLGEVAVIGRPGDLARGLDINATADEYVLVPQALPAERLEEITRLMVSRDGPAVRMAVNSSALLTNGVLISERGSVPLVSLQRARITGFEAILKRGLDLAGASIALLFLALPVLVALGRAVLTGRRPILDRAQLHAGERPIGVWLFDRQVSAWMPVRGAPALFAVLTGKLSLVGPRPVSRVADERFQPEPWLTAVKPGLTGPWRLTGPDASLETQALQDLTYVRNYSIWEDVRILWESLRRLRFETGAAVLGRWQEPERPEPRPLTPLRAAPHGQ